MLNRQSFRSKDTAFSAYMTSGAGGNFPYEATFHFYSQLSAYILSVVLVLFHNCFAIRSRVSSSHPFVSSVTNTKHHRDNSSNCKQYITWAATRPKPYNSSTLRSGNLELFMLYYRTVRIRRVVGLRQCIRQIMFDMCGGLRK